MTARGLGFLKIRAFSVQALLCSLSRQIASGRKKNGNINENEKENPQIAVLAVLTRSTHISIGYHHIYSYSYKDAIQYTPARWILLSAQ